MKTKWVTILCGELEREHDSKSEAVFWAQCTHCTESRPTREGEGYRLGRTLIIRSENWARLQKENETAPNQHDAV